MSNGKHTCKEFRMKGGNLVCGTCGEPSKSPRWRDNVFGANHKKPKEKE